MVINSNAIQVLVTADDTFGCFGGEPQFYIPVGLICNQIAYHYSCGDSLDYDDQTIIDLMLAGF